MKIERKDAFKGDFGREVEIDLKAVSEEGEIEGYGSIFAEEDRGGDVVAPGAFLNSLNERSAKDVKMLWQHNPHEPIGVWTEMREDERGLYVKGKLLTKVQRGLETLELLRAGAVKGLSIGYRTIEAVRNEDTGRRTLTKVDLWEVSVVTFPMNQLAGVTLVKSDGALPSEREFERYLTRDAGFSAQQAKAIIAGGYKALQQSARDAGDEGDAELARALIEAAGVLAES